MAPCGQPPDGLTPSRALGAADDIITTHAHAHTHALTLMGGGRWNYYTCGSRGGARNQAPTPWTP